VYEHQHNLSEPFTKKMAVDGQDVQDRDLPTENPSSNFEHQKIDHITSLQEGIDGFSLSLFEALRCLRDAVAPESGNLGGTTQVNNESSPNNSTNESSENDFEEFWHSYRSGDPDTIAMVRKVTTTSPQKREDFIRIHRKIEMEKDSELVKKVASTVLEKSADIDNLVTSLPGMDRTRTEQMKYIEELLEKNHKTANKLEVAYNRAEERRKRVRKFVRDHTCESLGIIED